MRIPDSQHIALILISTLSVSLMLSCGDPLKPGGYLGEPLGQIEVLIQPYQAVQGKWTDEEDWLSIEATCLNESEECTFAPDSVDCQLERSQCIQELRARVSWIQDPKQISFALLWLPVSQARSENTALDYLETRGALPQSPLRRASPDAPIPNRGALYLFAPPPESLMVEIDLTEQSYLAGVSGFQRAPSLLGIPLAFVDDDRDQRFGDDDTLIGLALDQGVLYTQLNGEISADTLKQLNLNARPDALARGFMSRVNYPFCSTPEQWTVPDPRVTPLVISLLELEPWVLRVELDRYLRCEAGVSPQCGSRADLRETCESSAGESELCDQCYDQLMNRYCGQVVSRCLERSDAPQSGREREDSRRVDEEDQENEEDEEDEEDRDDWDNESSEDDRCDAIVEICRIRAECLHLEFLCEAPVMSADPSQEEESWRCDLEGSARCYQERSCLIETAIQGDLADVFFERAEEEELTLEELVSDEEGERYALCLADGRYVDWLDNQPECISPWRDDFDLSVDLESGFTPSCLFKECERVYLACDHTSCEDEYLSCVTLMGP